MPEFAHPFLRRKFFDAWNAIVMGSWVLEMLLEVNLPNFSVYDKFCVFQ